MTTRSPGIAERVATWLRERDPGFAALRRAARTALVMPVVFALAAHLGDDPMLASFAGFGSFAMLLFVDFQGPMRMRLQAQAALAIAGAVLITLGTLASGSPWVAAGAMALVAFCVLFSGVVSSVLAGAATSLLLAFILSVSLKGPPSSIPDRLAGWGLAVAAALPAIALLWPAPARDPVRGAAIAACRAMAARLRAGGSEPVPQVEALHSLFFATPYRPTGLSTAARAVVRLVDELRWLDAIVQRDPGAAVDADSAAVERTAAIVLERGAELLDAPRRPPDALRAAAAELRARVAELERGVVHRLPATEGLEPGFRAQELSYVVSQIAANVDHAAAAERRSWLEQLLGRQPTGLAGPLTAAQERASAHVGRHSVWLQNGVRGAVGLGIAVLIANLSGVQHAFWVVLGTLSVLRSNALSTGQNVLRGLLGTFGGFVVGAVLVAVIGTETAVLWLLLPPAVFLAGLAPTAVSFTAGQAAFTVTLLILFNILAPEGWQIGLVRIEDVVLGSAVSLAVGLLFWPRGATAALGAALAEAYADSARYLTAAVRFGSGVVAEPTAEATRAAAASRRLDDAFRTYLAERGAKPIPLVDVTSLVTGVVGLRLAGDAVLDLWRDRDHVTVPPELLALTDETARWYERFATALHDRGEVPAPLPECGRTADSDVRVVWTTDYLDMARRLQEPLVAPARAAIA